MLLKIIISLFLMSSTIVASDFVVVVNANSELSKLSKKQIKDIFLRKRHFVNGKKMVPVNISASSHIRVAFEKKVLKTNRDKLNIYWVKKHFHGISPPTVQTSDKAMSLFVKNVKGAIGYLPKSLVDSGLKILYEF